MNHQKQNFEEKIAHVLSNTDSNGSFSQKSHIRSWDKSKTGNLILGIPDISWVFYSNAKIII
jgi:hypothetical protein